MRSIIVLISQIIRALEVIRIEHLLQTESALAILTPSGNHSRYGQTNEHKLFNYCRRNTEHMIVVG